MTGLRAAAGRVSLILLLLCATGCGSFEEFQECGYDGCYDPLATCKRYARDMRAARAMEGDTESVLRETYGRPSKVEQRDDGRRVLTYRSKGPTTFVIDSKGRVERWLYPPVGSYYHCRGLLQGCPEIRECPSNEPP